MLRQQRCRSRLQLEAGRAQGIRCLQREVGRHLQTGQAAILKQRHQQIGLPGAGVTPLLQLSLIPGGGDHLVDLGLLPGPIELEVANHEGATGGRPQKDEGVGGHEPGGVIQIG